MSVDSLAIEIDKDSPIPIYFQLERALIALIASGTLQPGDLLPSENDLSRRFHISPMTARQAMSQLAQQGYVRRERGRGTFVAPRYLEHNLDQMIGFSEDMQRRQLVPGARLLLLETVPAPPAVVAGGHLPPGTPMTRLKRLRLVNETPVGIHDAYLHNITLSRADLDVTPSLYALLAGRGMLLSEGVDKIEAVEAEREASELLHVKLGAAMLQTTRLSWDTRGAFVEYVVALYRADLYHYQIRLHRP
jgi:GntR family transcriptional regulator